MTTVQNLELYRATMLKVVQAMRSVLSEDEQDMLQIAREAGGQYWVERLRGEIEERDANRGDDEIIGVE
jgi:hypothetical protein